MYVLVSPRDHMNCHVRRRSVTCIFHSWIYFQRLDQLCSRLPEPRPSQPSRNWFNPLIDCIDTWKDGLSRVAHRQCPHCLSQNGLSDLNKCIKGTKSATWLRNNNSPHNPFMINHFFYSHVNTVWRVQICIFLIKGFFLQAYTSAIFR